MDIITYALSKKNTGGSSGATEEQATQIQTNTNNISELKEDISSLSETIADLQISGLTTEQVNALDGMFKVCGFVKDDVTAEYTAFKQAFGIESGGEEPDTPIEPDEPTTPTLTSISAVYAGGDVTEGTALTDLTGITVTAHYSDGSKATVTGYTLSGEIVEGSNTITVSYGGKTTTFTVTGVAEESGANETTAWENATQYSFGGIAENVRNAKATGTFAYQAISTDYIQMFNTGLGDDWNGIVIIDEEATIEYMPAYRYAWFMYANKEYFMRMYNGLGQIDAGTTDHSNDDYYKIENGIYYAKSMFTSTGYQPFVVGHRCRWFAW